jgi:hypothetical protein
LFFSIIALHLLHFDMEPRPARTIAPMRLTAKVTTGFTAPLLSQFCLLFSRFAALLVSHWTWSTAVHQLRADGHNNPAETTVRCRF